LVGRYQPPWCFLRDQGARDTARDLLASVSRRWFTESFDTTDLKEEKTRLDGLS